MMTVFIRRITLTALLAAIAVLAGTSLPTWWGDHLGGYRLFAHMVASGVVVVGLPLYGILRWADWLSGPVPSRISVFVFWTFIVAGFLTIGSMFVCMLPSTSTPSMITLIDFHGWIGSTMAILALLHLVTLIPGKAKS